MKKLVLVMFAFLLVITACTAEGDETTEGEQDHVVSVEVDEIKEQNLNIEKNFYGRATPEEVTPVIAQTVGEVQDVSVANGDHVEEDDVLFTMIAMETGMEVEITAPADGYVSDLAVSEEGIVTNEEPALLIVNLDELTIDLNVTAGNVDLFEIDDEVKVFSSEEETATATVEDKSLLPGETGLFTVTMTVDNDHDWKAGTVLTVAVTEETLSDVSVIPTHALVEQDNQTYVYIVEGNEVLLTEVSVLNMQSDITAIEGDIEVGDLVVTSGQLTLSDRSTVEVVGEDGES